MERSDVLIVGGGPAGSTCARQLRQAGLEVAVIDKAGFPRDKTCAGWVTPAVVESLGLDIEDYRQGRVFQPIDSFRTAMMGGPLVYTEYAAPVSYGIRRCEFDDYLLQRSGAQLHLGQPVKSIRHEDGLWRINDAFEAPLLIGAGGHFCPVARHLGAKLGAGEVVVAAKEVEFEMTPEQARACRVEPETPELYFCEDLTGYGWCFRKGDYLNIGLGREDNHQLGDHVQRFLDQLVEQGRVPADVSRHFKGHAYLLYGHAPRRRVADGVLLIGDAAGLAYPQSGEGIRPGVESALLAARTVLAANGDYCADNLRPYDRDLKARLGDEDGGGAAAWLPEGPKQFVAARLLASRWFSRHVVLDRWFLHRQQPALPVNG